MSLNKKIGELRKETFKEVLLVADYCTNKYRKENDAENWNHENGILGYPALILLFTIIDSLGSYFKGKKFEINGEKFEIKRNGTHFYILNDDLFKKQNLKREAINKLYQVYRNKLIHNLSLPKNYFLHPGKPSSSAFEITPGSHSKDLIYTINLIPLFELCRHAFEKAEKEYAKIFEVNVQDDDLEKMEKPIIPKSLSDALSTSSSGVMSSTIIPLSDK